MVGRMRFSRRAYRTVIVAHVAASVAWLGLSLSLLVLGLAAIGTADAGVQFAAATAASLLASSIAVPVGLVALVTGLLLSFGTRWSLAHRWVLVKLVATCVTFTLTVVLLRPGLAEIAAGLDPGRLSVIDGQMIAGPVVSSTIYLGAIALSYVKPWGRVGSRARRAPVPARSGR